MPNVCVHVQWHSPIRYTMVEIIKGRLFFEDRTFGRLLIANAIPLKMYTVNLTGSTEC